MMTENRVLFHRMANTLNYLDIKTVVVSCGTCIKALDEYEFDRIFPGCRIIDSPRERLVAILTNAFIPCNGRFPTLIVLISLFFPGGAAGMGRSLSAAAMLLGSLVLGVLSFQG